MSDTVTISTRTLAALVDVATEASLSGNPTASRAVADARVALELCSIEASVLGWNPAARSVRLLAESHQHMTTTHQGYVARIHHELLEVQAAHLGINLAEPASGVAALHAAFAVGEAAGLLARAGVLDREVLEQTATAASYTAMAVSQYAPQEVRR